MKKQYVKNLNELYIRNNKMTDMTKQAQIFDKILKKEENKLCADCRRKSPSWASLNLGVLVCMKCSGN